MNRLEGKISLISGGTTGMGAAIAKRFQTEGATVIATGITRKHWRRPRRNHGPRSPLHFYVYRNEKNIPSAQFGGKIRALRQRLKLTLDCTARAAGISKPFLSQIERGLAMPSIASLKGIADALGVAVQYFVDAPSEQKFVCRGEKLSFFEFADTANSFARLTHKSGGRRLEAVLVRFPPYQSGPADMPTSAEEEFLYVTSGEISLTLEGKTFVLKTGDSAHYQSTLPQGWLNNRSTEALAIWVGTPNLL